MFQCPSNRQASAHISCAAKHAYSQQLHLSSDCYRKLISSEINAFCIYEFEDSRSPQTTDRLLLELTTFKKLLLG
jgi:hypothetical protein